MIFPFEVKVNSQGNIIFEGEHIPSGKSEIIDRIFKCWLTEHEYNPITKTFSNSRCTCPDFNINKMKKENCKHIKEDLKLLGELL